MSERKILLRIIDVFVVLGSLELVGIIFGLEYFGINQRQWIWSVILAAYLLFFARKS